MTFDHLDDPIPYEPTAELRRAVVTKGRRLRRRRQVVTATALSLLVIFAGLTTVAAWTRTQLDHVERLDVGGSLDPPPDPGAINVLVLGTDRQPDRDLPAGADVVLVARLDRATGTVRVLWVPRDLWIDDGQPPAGRISGLLADGGPERVVAAVESTLELPIHHLVEIDLAGFRDLVDDLGGIDAWFDTPMRDVLSGLAVEETGCVHLDGAAVLSLVRARHLETMADGTWEADTSGDAGRIARQQVVAALLLTAAQEIGAGPGGARTVVDLATRHVAVDHAFTDPELVDWAVWALGLDRDDLAIATLGVEAGFVDNAAVLFTDLTAIGEAEAFLDGGPPAAGPATLDPAVPTPDACS